MIIEVRCEPHESLNWEKEKAESSALSSFFWKLQLGLEKVYFPIREEMLLATLGVAVEQFAKELLPLGGQGVILYQGSVDAASKLNWSSELEEQYQDWRQGDDSPFARKAFALDCYINYFQLLAHRLPDETPIFLLFEALPSAGETLALLSRPGLEHFQIALKNAPFSRRGWRWDKNQLMQELEGPKQGLLFSVNDFNFARFDEKAHGFEMVLESRLNEEWDGLEEIHLLQQNISERGERMLRGFEAAGGKIYRGRGI